MSAGKSGLVDVYGIWYHPWWHSSYCYGVLAIVGCSLIWILARCLKKYFWGVRRISIEQVALQDLYRLQSQMYVSDEVLHEAYFRVTMILKIYLSKRYKISLLDKTDQEIAQQLQGVVSEPMYVLLKEFFDRAFRIKFAYDSVSEQMLRDDIAFAEQVVQETSAQVAGVKKV